jgi:hypothetical protein
MKYDDASWHYEGNFPKDLPKSAGSTHIGMFVAWCVLNGMVGDVHTEDFPEELQALRDREITPGSWLIKACDGKFIEEDLNEEGNAFAREFFDAKGAGYLEEYTATLCDSCGTLYHVADTWENFDRLAPVIQARFDAWKKQAV